VANFVLKRVDLFPNGTTVEARKRSLWTGDAQPTQGTAPPGAAEKSSASDGTSISFNGLAANTEYVFSGQVGGVWKHTGAFTGSATTDDQPASYIGHLRKTVAAAGTPEQLGSGPCRGLVITALESNTGDVVIGGDNSVRAAIGTRNGTPIPPGSSASYSIRSLDAVWLDVEVAGNGVSASYEV
jgi:hypothetical protein